VSENQRGVLPEIRVYQGQDYYLLADDAPISADDLVWWLSDPRPTATTEANDCTEIGLEYGPIRELYPTYGVYRKPVQREPKASPLVKVADDPVEHPRTTHTDRSSAST